MSRAPARVPRSTPSARGWFLRLIAVTLAALLTLGVVEIGLRLYPWIYLRSRAQPLTLPGEGGRLIYVVGDSIPAGYKVQVEQAWPAQLGAVLSPRANPRYEVYNAAQPGASVVGVLGQQLSALDQVTPGTSIIGVLQVGHNDVFHLAKVGQAVEARGEDPSELDGQMKLTRLLRAFDERKRRWAAPAEISDEGRQSYAADVAQVCQAFQSRGGTCILATYPLCGVVSDQLPHDRATGYNRLRAAQVVANQLIRWTGTSLGLAVLDFEYLVEIPRDWSLETCNDAVHPSVAVHRRMGEAVATTLFPVAAP